MQQDVECSKNFGQTSSLGFDPIELQVKWACMSSSSDDELITSEAPFLTHSRQQGLRVASCGVVTVFFVHIVKQ